MAALRLYCAQINPTVGDFEGNYTTISSRIKEAKKVGADIIIFPELCITGYPPEDLLLNPAFINKNLSYLEKIKNLSTDIVVVAGFANASKEHELYNSAAVLYNQEIKSIYNKHLLPDYSVFDEERYFQKGTENYIYKIKSVPIGITVCEDIYCASGPAKVQSILGGAELIINISASPYCIGKIGEREKILRTRAVDNRVNIAYVNLTGGQDELVFDGNSLIVNEKGSILARAKPFQEDALIYDLDTKEISSCRLQDPKFKSQRNKMSNSYKPLPVIDIDSYGSKQNRSGKHEQGKLKPVNLINKYSQYISCREEEILKALILATRDYIGKNGFKKVVLGLSGGIDSALTAVIAAFAAGKSNVAAIVMPSIYSSQESIADAEKLSSNLGIKTITIPISNIYTSYLENLKKIFRHEEINVTKENIQARIRGNILMAAANENNWLVLSTGNKSEISVGYCTLYGDMVGGFSPIKDVYKTNVYSICKFINKKYSNLIPERIFTKAPSAELKPGQKDEDKLPPYNLLDPVLKAYMEEGKSYDLIVKMGFDEKTTKDVIRMVDLNEYKRRQGAPGVKITPRAFGKDRRYPITNKFRLV